VFPAADSTVLRSDQDSVRIREFQRHPRVRVVGADECSYHCRRRIIVDPNMQRNGAARRGRICIGPDIRTGPKRVGPVVAKPDCRGSVPGVSTIVFDPKRATTRIL